MSVRDWLRKTTAADIMETEVVTLSPSDALEHAASLFLRQKISGAPVVTDEGTCVDLLSVADLPRAEERVGIETQELRESSLFHSSLALPVSVYEQRLSDVRDKLVPAAEQPVERFMTKPVVGVDETTPLRSIVEQMVESHIHRVVVLDRDQRVRGLISTVDVLGAMLRAGGVSEGGA